MNWKSNELKVPSYRNIISKGLKTKIGGSRHRRRRAKCSPTFNVKERK